MKKKVMISYSHQNPEFVSNLKSLLRETNLFEVWNDQDIQAGTGFSTRIAEEIADSDIFLFIVSKSSLSSDWCNDEIDHATSLRKTIIPIIIEDNVNEQQLNRLGISRLQNIRIVERTIEAADLAKLIQAIKPVNGPPPRPEIEIYGTRLEAMQAFLPEIKREPGEIQIIGSSLNGFLTPKYNNIIKILFDKMNNEHVTVKFMLTHPAFADIRAYQEWREFGDIGSEIIETLKKLKEYNVKEHNVQLYLGTPTSFAVKTSRRMLLNPYPYGNVAYKSPCIIVNKVEHALFYDPFVLNHFSVWGTRNAMTIDSFDKTIASLETSLKKYAKNITVIYEDF